MHSLEPELEALRGTLGNRVVDPLIARERREIFSIHPELRMCGWMGATLLAAAAGIVVKNNLERIGPIALAALMAVAAAACYAFVAWRRNRPSVIDDYVLLLGALLVSADVAFIESQFHLFDANWKHHLILLAFVHAAGAYSYGSRMLLSLSITALAGWLGADQSSHPSDFTMPAFQCAVILLAWRAIDRRLHGTQFSRTFEHFAASIALAGATTLMMENEIPGSLAVLGIAAAVIAWGFRTRHEPFVLYGFLFAVIAVDVLVIKLFAVESEQVATLVIVVSIVAAIAALLALHARFRKVRA